jgi:YebC/PmpR family DNA-binding regulatory protein
MAGHSHWAGIKHKKEAEDKKRGAMFSKILSAITASARTNPNPEFNPKLRSLIEKAKDLKVPQENIQKAIERVNSASEAQEELLVEAYGPGGTAFLIEAVTNNKNRTISEIKSLFNDLGLKWAEPGGVRWAFEEDTTNFVWVPKFKQEINNEDKNKIKEMLSKIEEHPDVQKVYTNANL